MYLICQRQLRFFKSSMKIEVSFFDHSIEHIMKNISNLQETKYNLKNKFHVQQRKRTSMLIETLFR